MGATLCFDIWFGRGVSSFFAEGVLFGDLPPRFAKRCYFYADELTVSLPTSEVRPGVLYALRVRIYS